MPNVLYSNLRDYIKIRCVPAKQDARCQFCPSYSRVHTPCTHAHMSKTHRAGQFLLLLSNCDNARWGSRNASQCNLSAANPNRHAHFKMGYGILMPKGELRTHRGNNWALRGRKACAYVGPSARDSEDAVTPEITTVFSAKHKEDVPENRQKKTTFPCLFTLSTAARQPYRMGLLDQDARRDCKIFSWKFGFLSPVR